MARCQEDAASIEEAMQIGLQNWLLAVLPRRLLCFQHLTITQWFNPVAEGMLLAGTGLEQA